MAFPGHPLAVSALVAGLLVSVGVAEAQVLEAPPRPSRPLFGNAPPRDPNRVGPSLIVGLDALGGFDDNLSPEGTDAAQEFAPRPSGYVSVATGRVQFQTGSTRRMFELRGRSYMTTYRNIGLTPSYGSDVEARARTELGRRGYAEVRQAIRYEPFLSLGAFGTPGDVAESLDANPTNSLSQTRSWASDSAVSLGRRVTRRMTVEGDYGFSKRRYRNRVAFDSRTHSAGAMLDQSIARGISIRGTYRYTDLEAIDRENRIFPAKDNRADVGLRVERNLSPTRRMSFSFGGGATHVRTINDITRDPIEYWIPSSYASGQIDVARTWSAEGNYRRGAAILQGLTPRTFVVDGVNVGVGGSIAAGTDVSVSVGTSAGETGGQNSGKFRTYVAAGQLRFSLTPWWFAIVSYTRYQYRLDTAASQALGVAAELSRNAIRVGFAVSVPLL